MWLKPATNTQLFLEVVCNLIGRWTSTTFYLILFQSSETFFFILSTMTITVVLSALMFWTLMPIDLNGDTIIVLISVNVTGRHFGKKTQG